MRAHHIPEGKERQGKEKVQQRDCRHHNRAHKRRQGFDAVSTFSCSSLQTNAPSNQPVAKAVPAAKANENTRRMSEDLITAPSPQPPVPATKGTTVAAKDTATSTKKGKKGKKSSTVVLPDLMGTPLSLNDIEAVFRPSTNPSELVDEADIVVDQFKRLCEQQQIPLERPKLKVQLTLKKP
jgi:hypothetical protein